jgi:hypothetical protein
LQYSLAPLAGRKGNDQFAMNKRRRARRYHQAAIA